MAAHALDRIFVALADDGRRAMIEHLSRGPASVKELAAPTRMRLPSAVKHLKILEDSGLVVSRKVGRTRIYAMQKTAFRSLNDWVRDREIAMNAAFDRLTDALKAMPEDV
jgi:DNA-binding transcriptional ArsR family regulator